MRIEFTVYGHAQPAGSKQSFVPLNKKTGQPFRRANGGVVVSTVDANTKSKGWKQLVAFAAQRHRPDTPIEGPVRLTLKFYRQRPSGHFTKKGALSADGVRAPRPVTKPDVLKLARGVEDALTGVIWRDDAQIVEEILEKHWGETACVCVVVERVLEVVQ